MDLPIYPGASAVGGGGTVENADLIVWHQIVRTADSMGRVKEFYVKELETTRGWKPVPGAIAAWSNGNMTLVSNGGSYGMATANDPSLEGDFVQLIETDRETIADHWQSKPMPRKK